MSATPNEAELRSRQQRRQCRTHLMIETQKSRLPTSLIPQQHLWMGCFASYFRKTVRNDSDAASIFGLFGRVVDLSYYSIFIGNCRAEPGKKDYVSSNVRCCCCQWSLYYTQSTLTSQGNPELACFAPFKAKKKVNGVVMVLGGWLNKSAVRVVLLQHAELDKLSSQHRPFHVRKFIEMATLVRNVPKAFPWKNWHFTFRLL